MPDLPAVPRKLFEPVRKACLALPEAELNDNGQFYAFKIRRRVFAYLLATENPAGELITILSVRADPAEREVLLSIGHPYFPGNAKSDGLVVLLDAKTDWTEVAELVTESYRAVAPKKLAALLD